MESCFPPTISYAALITWAGLFLWAQQLQFQSEEY